MTDRRSTAALVFTDPRQAVGWLTARWAGPLIALLVWAVLLWDRPADATLGTWWSAASAVLPFGLGVLNVWVLWGELRCRSAAAGGGTTTGALLVAA